VYIQEKKKRKKMAAILFTKHKNWEIMTKKERKKKERKKKEKERKK